MIYCVLWNFQGGTEKMLLKENSGHHDFGGEKSQSSASICYPLHKYSQRPTPQTPMGSTSLCLDK